MQQERIGIHIDDLRLDAKNGIRRASELAFRFAELSAVQGETAAWELSDSGRRHLHRFAEGNGVTLVALNADIPRLSWASGSTVDERIARTIGVLEMASAMKVPTVTTTLPAFGNEQNLDPPDGLVQALEQIGAVADACNVALALRPTTLSGQSLTQLLSAVSCPALHVCLDPAELVMHGVDPLSSFDALAPHLGLAYARDATAGSRQRLGRETILGEGEVDLVGFLATLSAADYCGALVLRRTDAVSPAEELVDSRDRLRRMMG